MSDAHTLDKYTFWQENNFFWHHPANFKTDCHIDPNGTTLSNLNKTTSEGIWAGMSMIQFWITSAATGKLQMNEIEALAARLKSSPMRYWTDISDDFGDWLGTTFGSQILWGADKLDFYSASSRRGFM